MLTMTLAGILSKVFSMLCYSYCFRRETFSSESIQAVVKKLVENCLSLLPNSTAAALKGKPVALLCSIFCLQKPHKLTITVLLAQRDSKLRGSMKPSVFSSVGETGMFFLNECWSCIIIIFFCCNAEIDCSEDCTGEINLYISQRQAKVEGVSCRRVDRQ